MKPAAIIVLASLLALAGGAPCAADEPRSQPAVEAAAIKRAEKPNVPLNQPGRPAPRGWQRLDPVACAELCRLFDWLGTLEHRAPEISAPTS